MEAIWPREELWKESKLPEYPVKKLPQRDDFDSETLGIGYYAPRIDPVTFVDLKARPGWIRLRGQESGCSLNKTKYFGKKADKCTGNGNNKG